ncbi:MAG: sodium:solute symporter family protein [bacterium]|nr:sodium:solute symporter family protein [bacterium]
MSPLTTFLLLAYVATLIILSRSRGRSQAVEFLLAGRRLTLPAFVATLVTTWYGGILGVGEYAWRYGISTWLVFGVPYYLAALGFALLLARKLRNTNAISIPELLEKTYGRFAALTGSFGVLALALPVAYVLMLASLLQFLTGLPLPILVALSAVFSAVYVALSGFRAVVRTDVLQFVLMYGGFAILLPVALHRVGGFSGLWAALPESHIAWDGGLGWQAIVVWYLIALQTMVEPTFYQRVFAARSPRVAQTGVIISVALWAVFDFMTTFSGLAARALLPNLEQPLHAFPLLAEMVLPAPLVSLFLLALVATVMSTLDSYMFLAAATIGHDLNLGEGDAQNERRRTRIGLVFTALMAAGGALLFDSAVQVWHHVGSVVTSALLLPVLAIHFPKRWRPSERAAVAAMISAAAISIAWILAATHDGYPLGIEPMFPALTVSASICLGDIWIRRYR